MTTPAGTDPHSAPVPPGWPGDDPTVPEDLETLGRRRRPARSRARTTGPVRRRRAASDERVPRRHEVSDDGHDQDLDLDLVDVTDPDGIRLERDALGAGATMAYDDLVAGVQPAGRVLVIIVAALVLAMLVNADALVARAERKPPGAERDRSLAVWHPVQDVSHVLQLDRLRQVTDWAVGDDDREATTTAPARGARELGASGAGGDLLAARVRAVVEAQVDLSGTPDGVAAD